jgi:hypothetical protein
MSNKVVIQKTNEGYAVMYNKHKVEGQSLDACLLWFEHRYKTISSCFLVVDGFKN